MVEKRERLKQRKISDAGVNRFQFFFVHIAKELKREICLGHITMMRPISFDYLIQAFERRCGPSTKAYDSLPLTQRWISALSSCKDDWEERINMLSDLNAVERSSMGISLKTGQLLECKGERGYLTVRLGLLKLVCQVSGLTLQVLLEYLLPNLSCLRGIRAEILKINVVTTRYSDGKHASIVRDLKQTDFDPKEKFWTRFPLGRYQDRRRINQSISGGRIIAHWCSEVE